MRDIIKLGLILLLITTVSGLVLGVTNSMTEGIIQERAMAGDIASLQVLVSNADRFDPVEGDEVEAVSMVKEVFAGIQNDLVVGYAIKLVATGYGGDIEVMVGINESEEISGIEILSQSETPGLGSKITDPEYKNQFSGIAATGDISVDTISGATVSSKAVEDAVNAAVSLYQDVLKN